jgi:1,2-phenylacetyl-CoA epoxidase PaaB subunit
MTGSTCNSFVRKPRSVTLWRARSQRMDISETEDRTKEDRKKQNKTKPKTSQ